jgi:hypothetical protein
MTDPILAAHTISELMVALNTVYHLDLPTTMPPDTTLAELWAAAITVSKGGGTDIAYTALGSQGLPLPPSPPATVFVEVSDPDDLHHLLNRPTTQ